MEKREYTADELRNMQIWNFTQTDPIWDVLKKIILEKINNAKDNCFNSTGEIADLERGIGTGLNEFLVAIEAMADNGRKLAQGEPD